jgi:lantibiotic modifying enzyme
MSQAGVAPELFLKAAAGIGRALCRTAYWDKEGRWCNWVGRSTREAPAGGGPLTPTAAALGPDLYAGSAGVALFLAQLAAVTGDGECRRTADGALARSIRQADRQPPGAIPALSFHAGLVGLAYAAHRVAALTGGAATGDPVGSLLARAEAARASSHLLDVLGGNAGAIPALLVLGGGEHGSRAAALAVSLGDELCRTAVRQGGAWVWDVEQACGPGFGTRPLTGLAHGAAGLGLALLELYAATGREDFLEGGRAAFAYEDQLFDPRARNWPDLRASEPAGAAATGPHYMVAWCHGAAGIGLARLRARALDPARGAAYAAAAHAALDTTAATLEGLVNLPGGDATLCHGLCGLAETLLTGGQWLGEEGYRTRARAATAALVARHAAAGDWPSGVPSRGPSPSLMLGTAGVGYHLLRQYDPRRVPPVLVVVS